MVGGDMVQYESLKGTGETEFYNLMDIFKKKAEKQRNNSNHGRK
jgi:hypothetical protein